jgi:sugar phosphate isomerase/epimerase
MDAFGYNTFCKEAGFTQLDPWNAHIARAYDDNGYLAELKASGEDVGLPYGCIAVDGAHIYEPSAAARAENQRHRLRWLEIAAELGAEQLRIDAGGRDESFDAILPYVVEGYKDIIARATPLGVEIIIENHWGPSNHPDTMRRLLDAVPGLGLLFDSNNWPEGTHSRAWPEFAKDARLTHFKTFSFDAEGNEPDWDIPGLVRLFQSVGYNGAWGIESTPDDGDEIEAAKKTLALLKRCLES